MMAEEQWRVVANKSVVCPYFLHVIETFPPVVIRLDI